MKSSIRSAVLIRRVGLNRLGDLLALEESGFQTDRSSPRNLRHLLRSSSALSMGAYRDGRLVGSIVMLFRSTSRVARVYSIAVSPEVRGAGIGRRMMVRAEREAKRRGCDRMRLEVRMDNIRAIRLYEDLGYEDVQVLPGYYEDGAHAMVMRKELA